MKDAFDDGPAAPGRIDWQNMGRSRALHSPAGGQRMRIAALDDDPAQLDLLRRVIESMGHVCVPFARGRDLLEQLGSECFDLLVIDWQLPDISGLEIVRRVRRDARLWTPILIVTNRTDERDIVEGLASGADDYMVKPMRVREASARLAALLRRRHPQHDEPVQDYGDFRFDLALRQVSFRGEPIELKQKEFELARCLFANAGRLLSRSYLRATIWGAAGANTSRTLDTHVSALRTKLGLRPERGWRLSSIYGQGYRLEPIVDAAEADAPLPREAD